MKKLLIVLALAFAFLATSSIFAQDKPSAKKDQKTEATAKSEEKCSDCATKEKKETSGCKCCCCAKKEEAKKCDMKHDEKKQDEKK